ncbi:MAG: hypothetical protein QXM75_02895 [Candidatus Diapherotrites archaeon]
MITDKIGAIYSKIEDKWFALLQFLQEKGIPAYSYAEFLETRGIPSLPFTLAIFVLLLVLILTFTGGTTAVDVNLTIIVRDDAGQSLNNVKVEVYDDKGNLLKSDVIQSGYKLTLKGVKVGTAISARAYKEGYKTGSDETEITSAGSATLTITLKRELALVSAKVRLIDELTSTTVRNALCTVNFDRNTFNVLPDSEGTYNVNVPPSTDVVLKCSADGYEDLQEALRFKEGETKVIKLKPKAISAKLSTLLISVYDEETRQLLKGVNIKIINTATGTTITDYNSQTGDYSEKIKMGTSISVTVEKAGYQTYVEEFTLRTEEVVKKVYLKKGGSQLTVNVLSKEGIVQVNAEVSLFDLNFNLISTKKTGALGNAIFEGVDPNKDYHITAFKDGFLPFFSRIQAGTKSLEVRLEKPSVNNSAIVKINVIDSIGNPANNATVRYYRLVNEYKVPLGIPPRKVGLTGTIIETMPEGNLLITAENEKEYGEEEVQILPGIDKEVNIKLIRKPNFVELRLLDENGLPVKGKLTVTSKSGKVLFSGNVDGNVVFDNEMQDSFLARLELPDGRIIEQEVRVGPNNTAELRVGPTSSDVTKPTIDFIGVFDVQGKQIDGVVAGEFAWLQFSVSFPQGIKSGVHVRVGSDSIPMVESQQVGIFGFDGNVSSFIYGKSYQPPLGEQKDLSNRGTANERNKWVELYFDNAPSQAVVGIKVKTDNITKEKEFEVHYRAWSEIGTKVFRDPTDSVLGEEKTSTKKQALYAETKKQIIKIFENEPSCNTGLCLELSIIDSNNLRLNADEFSAEENGVYALEITLSAAKKISGELLVKSETNNVLFSTLSESVLSFNPQGDFSKPELRSSVRLDSNTTKVVRAYFKSLAFGSATIDVSFRGTDLNVSKRVSFNIKGSKELIVELYNNGIIKPGEKLRVVLKDLTTKEPIKNAFISVERDGEVLLSVTGNDTLENGANGVYLLGTDKLSAGKYVVKIKAQGYKDVSYPLVISTDKVLRIEPQVEILLNKGEKEKAIRIRLTNASFEPIDNIGYEIKEINGDTSDFNISVSLPERIDANRSIDIVLNVVYNGDLEKRAYAEFDLSVNGSQNPVVSTTSRIKIAYNKEIPSECIEVDKSDVDIHMSGMLGSSEVLPITIAYKKDSQCIKPLTFTPKLVTDDNKIALIAQPFTIAPGETKTLEARITNNLERVGIFEQKVDATLILESPELTKSISLSIYFTDPSFALQTNDNIPIFMSFDPAKGTFVGMAPLFAKNFGKKVIENIRWSVKPPQQIEIYVLQTGSITQEQAMNLLSQPGGLQIPTNAPSVPYIQGNPAMASTPFAVTLAPGEEMEPKTILATSTAANLTRGPHKGEIVLTGTVDGKQFQKVVSVWVIVSSAQCIKIAAIEELYFSSEDSSQGVISKKISIKNECGEVLRNFSVKPANLGNNTLTITLLGGKDVVYPDESVQAQLVLTKRGDYFNIGRPNNISVSGFLVNSQKFVDSNPLPILVEIGKKPDVLSGPVYKEVQIPVCDEPSGSTKTVQFPITSADIGCDSAYCDSWQLAGHIVERIKGVMQKVERLLQQSDAATSYPICNQAEGFCSFSALGIVPEVYTVYMKNDYLGKEVLQRRVESSKEFATFVTEYFQGDVSDIVKSATGFTTSKIFITKPLMGCGRYKISVQGAVQNIQGRLSRENYFILVKVVEDLKVTPECTMRVQNIANFLPANKGLSADRPYNTWLGVTEGSDALKPAAELLAQKLFDDKSRVNVAYQTNKLRVLLSDIEGSGIAKIYIQQVSQQQAQPVTVGVGINKMYVTLDEKMQSEIVNKAAEAVDQLIKGSFTLEGCITRDESALIISKLEYRGDLSIETAAERLELYYGIPVCMDMNVVATTTDSVELKTSFSTMSDNEKTGLEDVWLEVDGKRISEYSDSQSGTPLKLEKVDEEGKTFKKEFKLCVKANDAYFEFAAGKKIGVKARSALFATKEMRSWREITLELCGIHPYKLIEKMVKEKVEPGKSKVFYATVGWKGDPDAIDFAAAARALTASDRLKKAQELMEDVGKGGRIDDSPVGQKILGLKQQGYGIYFGSCFATSFVCNAVARPWFFVTWPGLFLDVAFDCAPTSIGGLLGTTKGGRGFLASLGKVWDSVKSIFPWTKSKTPDTEGDLSNEAVESYLDDALPAAILGESSDLLLNEFRRYVLDKGGYWAKMPLKQLGTQHINTIASEVSNRAVTALQTKYLLTADPTAREAFTNSLRKSLKDKLTEALNTAKQNPKMTLKDLLKDNAIVKKIWRDAAADPTVKSAFTSNIDSLGNDIKDLVKDASAKQYASIFQGDLSKLASEINPFSSDVYLPTDVEIANAAKKIAENATVRLELDPSAHKQIINDLKNDLKARLSYMSKGKSKNVVRKIPKSELDDAIGKSIDMIGRKYKKEISEYYGKKASEKILSTMGDDLVEGEIKPGLFRRMWDTLKTWQFWGRMAKSIACGAVSNAAGYATYSAHVRGGIENLIEKGYVPEAGITIGDASRVASNYTGPPLLKNRTYKITISKDDYGNISYKLELVDTPEKIEEMRKAISQNPLALWREDCAEYRERGVSEMVGCLVPKPEEYIKPEEVVAYYKNSGSIKEASINFNVREALIMAALTTSFENFEPCPVKRKWYEGEESEVKLTINCVARHISEKLAANQNNIRAAFELLSKDKTPDKARRYALDIEAKYNTWRSYEIASEGCPGGSALGTTSTG